MRRCEGLRACACDNRRACYTECHTMPGLCTGAGAAATDRPGGDTTGPGRAWGRAKQGWGGGRSVSAHLGLLQYQQQQLERVTEMCGQGRRQRLCSCRVAKWRPLATAALCQRLNCGDARIICGLAASVRLHTLGRTAKPTVASRAPTLPPAPFSPLTQATAAGPAPSLHVAAGRAPDASSGQGAWNQQLRVWASCQGSSQAPSVRG